MKLSDGVIAYHVLKSANLSEENEKLARATITTLTYKSMTEQLKKIFGDMSKSLSQQVNLRVEPTFHNENFGPDEEMNFVYRGRFQYKGKRSCALLDSGCTKTVCGSFWVQCYVLMKRNKQKCL